MRSQSTGWAEPPPNQVLFLEANTLKVKPLKLAAGVVIRNHGLTSIICFLAEAVELLVCYKVKNEFYVRVARTISRSLVRYFSCHSNIKFISSRHRVISSIYLALQINDILFPIQCLIKRSNSQRFSCNLTPRKMKSHVPTRPAVTLK